jgi:ABC-type transport system involved in multi-copper enzyme maturation permease subunit
MIWTAWRQQRSLIVTMSIVATALMASMLITGLHEQGLWNQFLARPCQGNLENPVRYQTHCNQLLGNVEGAGYFNRYLVIASLVLGPLFGSILGASAVAREVERRTTRLVWTQSGSRSQWLATKYLVNIAILFAIFVPICIVLAWWNSAAHYSPRITPSGFLIAGFLLLLYSIVAFVVVATLGLFIRRAGWTLATGLVLAGVLIFTVEVGVRPRLVSPEFMVVSASQVTRGSSSGFYSSGGVPSNSWSRGQGYAPIGIKLTPNAQTLNLYSNKMQICLSSSRGQTNSGYEYCFKKLDIENVGLFVPNSDFWQIQIFEGLIYFGVVLVFGVASFSRVRRMLA